ncbi:SPARC-like isoform X2 [Dreissena polymorpha]|uniref:SPARC-like isoform X2 n=1 Tax=Dreissena polymorpha TaxID=45954 RepID=UPI002264717B|nr:SPARC-like isoform X2 [Dreissena polymorpha]
MCITSTSGEMKISWLLILALVVTAVVANEKTGRRDKDRRKVERPKRIRSEGTLDKPKINNEEEDDGEYTTVDVKTEGGAYERSGGVENPCNKHRCKRGEVCVLEERQPVCVCQTCDEPVESEPQVCSRNNVTYVTECELDRDHCLCRRSEPGCRDDTVNHVRIDYFSACKELTACPTKELENFPSRMRDWLFRVMTTMAYRHELDDYHDLAVSALEDKKHADAVIWEFCDLDKDPEDRQVTRRELMYIIASVKSMEHCLVPFLDSCDKDSDSTITLVEWGTCLEIGHEAIVDKCHKKIRA